jgi:hypothetical protein
LIHDFGYAIILPVMRLMVVSVWEFAQSTQIFIPQSPAKNGIMPTTDA